MSRRPNLWIDGEPDWPYNIPRDVYERALDAAKNATNLTFGQSRNPGRIDHMLALLRAEWTRNPDFRLGQLVLNAANRGGWTQADVFNCEDDVVELGLREMSKK